VLLLAFMLTPSDSNVGRNVCLLGGPLCRSCRESHQSQYSYRSRAICRNGSLIGTHARLLAFMRKPSDSNLCRNVCLPGDGNEKTWLIYWFPIWRSAGWAPVSSSKVVQARLLAHPGRGSQYRQSPIIGYDPTFRERALTAESVESPGGISPPGAPRTVHDPLESHGSRCSAVAMT